MLSHKSEGNGNMTQVVDDHESVVSCVNRVLSRSVRKYCATHQEMLLLVWAVHIFRPFLYGKRFTLRTDYNWLHHVKVSEGQVARWLEALAEFDYKMVHHPGKQHHADAFLDKMCMQCAERWHPVSPVGGHPRMGNE